MNIEGRHLKFIAPAEWGLKGVGREDVEMSNGRLVAGGMISDK